MLRETRDYTNLQRGTMDSDLVYSSDCYLQKRGSMRKGFGGNYRRASDSVAVPRVKPSSPSGSGDAKPLDKSLKSSSFCHKNRSADPDPLPSSASSGSISLAANTENPQQSKSIQQSDFPRDVISVAEKKLFPRDAMSVAEKKLERNGENVVAGHGTCSLPSTKGQVQGQSEFENRPVPLVCREGPLLELAEDESSSVSVKECVKTLERTDTTIVEEKFKPPAKIRVAELRDMILRRSSENLVADATSSDPPKVNKRPVSALLESSFGTFPKIPISLIQRRSIGSLLKPSLPSVQLRPLGSILNPVVEPKLTAGGKESNVNEEEIDGSQNNPPRRRSFMNFSSLNRKEVRGNSCSLQGKSKSDSSNKTTRETEASCDIGLSGSDPLAGSLIKTDSSDSGIDTKTDCFGNKSSPDRMEVQFQTSRSIGLVKFSSSAGHQSTTETFSHVQCDDSVSPEQCSGLNKLGNTSLRSESAVKGNSFNLSNSMNFVDLESEELAQVCPEEVLYEELAVRFLNRLKDNASDLRAVLKRSEFERTPFYYMANVIQGIKIPEFWIKLPTVNIHVGCESTDRSLEEDQKTLLDSIKTKQEAIKRNRELIKQKVIKRKELESQVSSVVKCRLEKKKYEKFCLYLSELDKVLHLMFMLASRLANTENELNCPRPEDNETVSKLLMAKRASLIEKLEDAKLLKDGIDHRSIIVNSFLKESLSKSEYAAYQDLVSAIVRLHFLHQWTEDRLLRCEKQMKAVNATLIKSGSLEN